MMCSRSSARRRKTEIFFGLTDPAPDRTVAAEVEAALMSDAGIGQQRNVGERDGVAGKAAACGEMLLHAVERRIAALDLFGIELRDVLAEIDHVEAAHRHVGLVAILFP